MTIEKPELYFALVGAIGTRLHDLSQALKEHLQTFGYEVVDVRLSELLNNFTHAIKPPDTTEFDRIRHLQDAGNAFRGRLEDGAALARAGIAEIRAKRAQLSGSPERPAPGRAYIIHQLKHPDEVRLLRQVYGSSFLLVAGHAPRRMRVTELTRRMARCEDQSPHEARFLEAKAVELIELDEKEGSEFGQNTRDTYPQADFFANLGIPSGEHAVRRFVDLLFGHPFYTPKPDEYAMYQASAVGLRSSDDNRQVGAVIVSLTRNLRCEIRNADVIAVGMNEVPRGGGGFYWDEDSPDLRDQSLVAYRREDRASDIKVSALAELIDKVRRKGWLSPDLAEKSKSDLARSLLGDIKGTQFMDIGEFSRPVHAEMAALIDGARRGVAVNGHTMYVTTFPCHNCAKHIIAAGIQKVVFLEPYAKSRASNLHGEEIDLESMDEKLGERVVFAEFSGIAPRQYGQLFSMSERGAKRGIALTEWPGKKRSLLPKYVIRNAACAYLVTEVQELAKLPLDTYKWDKEALCPNLGTGSF